MHVFISHLCFPLHQCWRRIYDFQSQQGSIVLNDALGASLRAKADALKATIAAYNKEIEPLSRAVADAQADYNETVERARNLAGQISDTAQEDFDAKSERWQDSDTGIQVRSWIEQWEMSLDDVDLELPEPLEEIDPRSMPLRSIAALAGRRN